MSLLIETIKVTERQFQNIAFHNKRLNRSRKELLGDNDSIEIEKEIVIPADIGNGVYKCTVKYKHEIIDVKFQSYTIKKIEKLKLVIDNSIDYSYKFADRSVLSKLLEKRDGCDEIIIVKNGLMTDTSYSNLVFFDGKKWYTPNSPLLKGTKREKLLSEGKIEEEEINLQNIKRFEKVSLINAMLDVENVVVSIENVIE
jgi:4-amino-4-deoxychorismate lyase